MKSDSLTLDIKKNAIYVCPLDNCTYSLSPDDLLTEIEKQKILWLKSPYNPKEVIPGCLIHGLMLIMALDTLDF
jgi:hypothetical protein